MYWKGNKVLNLAFEPLSAFPQSQKEILILFLVARADAGDETEIF